MKNNLEDEVKRIVERMENQENQDNTQIPQEDIQDIYVLIVREHEIEEKPQVVDSDSTPVTSKKVSVIPAYAICACYLFLIFSCIAFQVYEILNPPIATITIIPKSQTVSLTGTLQLGRILSPLTISQSQTVPTTGKGHQDTKAAAGDITFYNGEFQIVSIAAGTILTGTDGVSIITDQSAVIPAGNPPTYGQVSVSAHAITAGSRGNIAAYDINEACCAASVLAKNTSSFYGGVDERHFQTVTKADITNAATPLKSTVLQNMSGALQGQLKTNEQLQILPCSPTVTPNHNVGDEAIQVQVTVSEMCSAVAYKRGELETKAAAFLSTQAVKKVGPEYTLLGTVKVTVLQASVSSTSHTLVFLSFQATGTWIYGLSRQSREHIKELIAGKTKVQALHIIASMPGIEKGSIAWGDDTKLPKDSRYIHIVLLVF